MESRRVDRREFLALVGRRGVAIGVAGVALPSFLAACAREDDPTVVADGWQEAMKARNRQLQAEAEVVVGDVVDFALTSDDWPGVFGFVTLAMHEGTFDGNSVWFIRTDASDRDFASEQRLVLVPKLAGLNTEAGSGEIYLIEGGTADQAAVLSSEPGREDWTPAMRVRRVTWTGSPRTLTSVADITEAERAGAVTVDRTAIVLNAAVVKWSDGELAADNVRTEYLGPGQLLEPPDTANRRVTFKLNECYPASRYIVTEHSMEGAAEMTSTVFAPRLQEVPTRAGATGRTNVFMNGPEGPGPMGFQPSAFDFDAGDAAWSPYWDHYMYGWRDPAQARVLRSEQEIHAARDAGELDEFPGMPETEGEVFTVNCPVPVLAPPAYEPPA